MWFCPYPYLIGTLETTKLRSPKHFLSICYSWTLHFMYTLVNKDSLGCTKGVHTECTAARVIFWKHKLNHVTLPFNTLLCSHQTQYQAQTLQGDLWGPSGTSPCFSVHISCHTGLLPVPLKHPVVPTSAPLHWLLSLPGSSSPDLPPIYPA